MREVKAAGTFTLYDDGKRLYFIPTGTSLKIDLETPEILLMHAAAEVIEKCSGKILKHRYAHRDEYL